MSSLAGRGAARIVLVAVMALWGCEERAAGTAPVGSDGTRDASAICVEALASAVAAAGAAGTAPPDPDVFESVCVSLPEEAQRCLGMEHALTHAAECARVQRELPPEQRQRLREIARR